MHYLEYKNEQLPITIDFGVVKAIAAGSNIKLSEFERTIENPDLTSKVCFEGLKRGHKLEGKAFSITETDVDDILSYENNYGLFMVIFGEDVLKMFNTKKKN